MNAFRASAFAFFSLVTLSLGTLAGCAAETDETLADGDEGADEAALSASAAALAGNYSADGAKTPAFRSLSLRSDGSFYAEIDTGVRCVRAPCTASGAQIWGSYSAGAKTLTLRAEQGAEASRYYGRYAYTRTADGIVLTRSGSGWQNWQNTLAKAPGIWSDDVTKLAAENSGGGFAPPGPPGSSCARSAAKYELDLATRTLAYARCEAATPTAPFAMKTGSKKLSAAQTKAIVDAARAASIHTGDMCGADKPMLSVRVTTPAGTKKYLDAFYSCRGGSSKYIDGIDAIFGAMSDAL